MTFFANRSENKKQVDVNVTYGPITIKVVEDPGHLRSFHSQLGEILTQVEGEQAYNGKD